MGDEAVAKIGTMLEHLSSRFELVVEVVSGYGGQLQALREELFGQFAEVGKQIRFLSEQIAENREGMAALRAELTAEMVRLNEALGATRVEFREQLSDARSGLRGEIAEAATSVHQEMDGVRAEVCRQVASVVNTVHQEIGSGADGLRERMAEAAAGLRTEVAHARESLTRDLRGASVDGDKMRQEIRASGSAVADLKHELTQTASVLKGELAKSAEHVAKQVRTELKETGKALTSLSRKFERFDDRISVQVKDHDLRLRKVERRARG